MEAQVYRDFDEQDDGHWWFKGRRAIVRRFLEAHLPSAAGRKVLDVGCGTGGMLPMLADFGTVTGLEANAEALEAARRRAPSARLLSGVLPGAVPRGETFELITAFDVIEHIAPVVETLVELNKVLAPGGRLVVTVPAYMFLWSEHDEENHHQRRYTQALLTEHLGAAGFAVEKMSSYNSLLFPAIAAARLAQRVLPKRGKSDMGAVPPLINFALERLFSAERHAVARLNVPVGVSIIAMARAAGGAA